MAHTGTYSEGHHDVLAVSGNDASGPSGKEIDSAVPRLQEESIDLRRAERATKNSAKNVEGPPDTSSDKASDKSTDSGRNTNKSSDKGSDKNTGSDERVEKGTEKNNPGAGFDNPFRHVGLAGQAIRELQAIATRPGDEKLVLSDDLGRKSETTVKQRREQLEKAIENEFASAIKGADGIDQSKVEASLFEVRDKIKAAKERATNNDDKSPDAIKEAQDLKETETALESLKHAPSASRFAYAMYLAGSGKLEKASEQLKLAGEKDPEAEKDNHFVQFKTEVEKAIAEKRGSLVNKEEFMLPLITMNIADGERAAGNKVQAEAAYRKAIAQADNLDQSVIKEQLESLAKERAAGVTDLESRELAWAAVAHSPALSRINLADFLLSEGRGAEAQEVLLAAAKIDPELVKDKKEFKDMLEQSEKIQTARDLNPFQHLENFKKAIEDKNIDKARTELKAAVTAADNIDRNLAQSNKKVIAEQLKVEQNPETKKELQKAYEIYDAFDHAAAFTRIALGRFELSAKNYNVAHSNFEDAKKIDPALTSRKEIEIDKLLDASLQPSTWRKILTFTKEIAKDLVADAAAILAGAGAVVLTGWTGPGAIVAGAAAGAAAYTGVHWLMGDDIHWYTPLWGAVDGATGAVAALARQALINQGGKIVSKQIAEAAVLKTGGNATALAGMEGMKMSEAAQKVAAAGLKTMGKDIGIWSRLSSAVPFIGTGNAEYRSALAAYRALSYSNLGLHAAINGGTALTASVAYRGAHEGVNYYNGTHSNFNDFAKAYGTAMVKDTLRGVVMGGYMDGWGDGLAMSTAVNAVSTKLTKPQSVTEFLNTFTQKTGTDLAFGSVAWLVGIGGYGGDHYIHPGISDAIKNSSIPSVALWSDAYYMREHIKNVIEPMLKDLNKKPSADDIAERHRNAPGTSKMPAANVTG